MHKYQEKEREIGFCSIRFSFHDWIISYQTDILSNILDRL